MEKNMRRLIDLCVLVIDDLEEFEAEFATNYAIRLQEIINEENLTE